MGQHSLYRLEVIKARFIDSSQKDLQGLLSFVEEQLGHRDNEHESKFTIVLDRRSIDRIKTDVSEIDPVDLETILDFVEERIEINRSTDKGERIMGLLTREEFYLKEEKYSEIESFILKLTLG